MAGVTLDYRRIAQAADIFAVARAMGLTINSRNKALCPFHGDHKPSMQLYSDHYHCFVCGAHGDVIELVQGVRKCSKQEAAECVARLGNGELYAINEAAAERINGQRQAWRVYDAALEAYQTAEAKQAKAKELVSQLEPFSVPWEYAQANYLYCTNRLNTAEERLIRAKERMVE